jgi:ubiquinol-cytochrome c reductase cytochrome b subunit
MKWFFDWLDDRTGYRQLVDEALNEPIPGGARWRYVWGSTLVFTFSLQLISGVFLWSAYSPSAQTAWESVYYIQHEMTLGYLVRGIHHYAAQFMVVLLALHLMQVIIDGAYRAPREINYWLGLILAQIVLALSLTGYLLPWDQKGYYATQVSTKIMGATPGIGQSLQELAQGGPEYGHHTLTRFFAMHAGILPGLLVAFLALHLYVFRRHGLTVRDPERAPVTTFWPDQMLRDAVACLGVLAVVLLLAVFRGAELSAPANPAEAYSAARPEWYFLFLFRFLRFEAIEHFGLAFGAIYVPTAILAILFLMPIVALIKGGHRFNVFFMWLLAIGIAGLTAASIIEDRRDPEFQAAVAEAERDGHRAVELAKGPSKIPVQGAGALLHNDPFTQGPRLFAKHCSSCHRFDGHDGRGRAVVTSDPETRQTTPASATAPDLGNFASRQWWREILTNFEQHFSVTGKSGYDLETSASEGMISWSRENAASLRAAENQQDLAAIIEFLVAQNGRDATSVNAELVRKGQEILGSGELTSGSFTTCDTCHAGLGGEFVAGSENGGVPELNQYGSRAWLTAFLQDPGHEQFYGDKNQMPAFAKKMSEHELSLLVRFLTRDYAASEIAPYPALLDTELPEAIVPDVPDVELPAASAPEPDAAEADSANTDAPQADAPDPGEPTEPETAEPPAPTAPETPAPETPEAETPAPETPEAEST